MHFLTRSQIIEYVHLVQIWEGWKFVRCDYAMWNFEILEIELNRLKFIWIKNLGYHDRKPNISPLPIYWPQLHQYCRYHFLAIKNPNTMQELFKLVLGAFFRFVDARCKSFWWWIYSRNRTKIRLICFHYILWFSKFQAFNKNNRLYHAI